LNIGSRLNHLGCQATSLACGHSKAQRTCTSSKSEDIYNTCSQLLICAQSCYSLNQHPNLYHTILQNSSSFVTFSLPDRQNPRLLPFWAASLTRKYDESLEAIQQMQQAGTAVYKVEDMEFGRRLAMERELEIPGPDGRIPGRWSNRHLGRVRGVQFCTLSLLGIKGEVPCLSSCVALSLSL